MGVQLLSELREPPVVGKFYMVPVVRSNIYVGFKGDWPVIGPKHTDKEHFQFPDEHYHVDARFLTAKQQRQLDVVHQNTARASGVEGVVGAWPLRRTDNPHRKGLPDLVRRKCRFTSYGYAYGAQPRVKALNEHYGAPAKPIRRADGRLLCPHRKADLSQFAPDADGIVTCPLHGLRVCVREHAA